MELTDSIWCVAYINRDKLAQVDTDIRKFKKTVLSTRFCKPEDGPFIVEAYIPTVRYLKKQFKGKAQFEEIPLLFNYGFFKIPWWGAINEEFLGLMRRNVTCIYSWVKDTSQTYHSKPNLRADNSTGNINIAKVTDKEIASLIRVSEDSSVFSDLEVSKLAPGDTITLRGYPFDNIPAKIVSIHKRTQEVKVQLLLETMMTEVKVSFSNVFYTIYSDYSEDMKELSIEDLKLAKGNKQIDKIYAKINYGNE